MAIFFQSKKGCSETMLDNSPVKVTVLATGEVVFEVSLKEATQGGRLLLKSRSEPLRTLERFQLVYPCEVIVR